MNRRDTIAALLALGVAAKPFGAAAQAPGKIRRIGLLSINPRNNIEHLVHAFEDGLRDHGYVNGKNTIIEYRFAGGKLERLPALARELAQRNVEVIVTATNPGTLAARDATVGIPVVTAVGSNVIGSGLAASLARPGGRITGLTFDVGAELWGKRLELLKEAVPKVSRVAVLWDPLFTGSPETRREIERAALALRVSLAWIDVSDDLDGVIAAALRERADALLPAGGARLFLLRARLAELASKHRLPAVYTATEHSDAGGLMSYAPSLVGAFRDAARFVDKILKGAKPGDLPFEQPTKFELVINLKTAKALGLTIPQSLLLRADRVIE